VKGKRNEASSRVQATLEGLGINADLIASRRLPRYEDAQELIVADVSKSGREHMLVPAAARAWSEMKASAQADGITLIIVSAFRSIERQAELVKRKLLQGSSPELILKSSAPPGYSEHHTGRAVDIGTPNCAPLVPEFEDTAAYTWLIENATGFGFSLSYPRDNRFGYCYEPWHWLHECAA